MRGKAPAPKDTIAELLYPTHGVRDEQIRRGVKPRDHRVDHRRYLKQLQQKVREKDEAAAAAAAAVRPGKVAYKVGSRVSETISRPLAATARRQSAASPKPKSFLCGKNFGGGAGVEAAWDLPPPPSRSQAELRGEARAEASRSTPSRPPSASKVDFVKWNVETARYATPRTPAAGARTISRLGASSPFQKSPSYGKVPAYILDRKLELAKLAREDPRQIPKGYHVMAEDARLKMLDSLRQSKEHVNAQLGSFRFVIDTPGQIKKHQQLNQELDDLEAAEIAYSRSQVLVVGEESDPPTAPRDGVDETVDLAAAFEAAVHI